MRKLFGLLLFFLTLTLSFTAYAILSMELTRGVSGAIPISVVPFANADNAQDPGAIIANDLQNSGRFKVYGKNLLTQFPTQPAQVSSDYFRKLGTDNVVIGTVSPVGNDRYEINFHLVETLSGTEPAHMKLSKKYVVAGRDLRAAAHRISDDIYNELTGVRGIFSTKLAYVVVQRENSAAPKYILEVADQDGYNPRPLLTSSEPIMSPAWSADGKRIAYVSFEKKRASIYIEEVASGARRLISQFAGINGAPAWSPDGKKIAVVLSKSGSPNIYLIDVASGAAQALTHDFYINTEPAWAPDGRHLLFTSNRSGGPQIYQINLDTGGVNRISYEGDYNARASYSQDGKSVAMIHRVGGVFNIALLDLDTGNLRVVLSNQNSDSTSPSIAPNGSMILYDTYYGGRNLLSIVSADGRVQLRLPARNGEAQDPAWSPFLS